MNMCGPVWWIDFTYAAPRVSHVSGLDCKRSQLTSSFDPQSNI